MTYHEGHLVRWADHPTLLLPAERGLTSGERKRRVNEAFVQRQQEPDAELVAKVKATAGTELAKIRELFRV